MLLPTGPDGKDRSSTGVVVRRLEPLREREPEEETERRVRPFEVVLVWRVSYCSTWYKAVLCRSSVKFNTWLEI